MQMETIVPEEGPMVHTISCDEKPGIQAIATTTDDLRPTAENGTVSRDYEYKRLGTLSLLAGIDLAFTGKAVPVVSETHKSSDFIGLLKKFDEMYPGRRRNPDYLRQSFRTQVKGSAKLSCDQAGWTFQICVYAYSWVMA